jgi:NADPH:quinone reductase-like Zn-dependent oxidoreductase
MVAVTRMPGEVRILTEVAAVNFTDLQIRAGAWPIRKADPFPYTPGVEVVGTIESARAVGAGARPSASASSR